MVFRYVSTEMISVTELMIAVWTVKVVCCWIHLKAFIAVVAPVVIILMCYHVISEHGPCREPLVAEITAETVNLREVHIPYVDFYVLSCVAAKRANVTGVSFLAASSVEIAFMLQQHRSYEEGFSASLRKRKD